MLKSINVPSDVINAANAAAAALAADVVKCPSGTYSTTGLVPVGTTGCTSCGSGTYSTVGASSCSYSATTCPAGTYASGAAACEPCASGKYNEQISQTSESVACKNCAAGEYQNQEGKASCKTCASGQYSTIGASLCDYTATTCPAGTYANGTAVCDSCASGQYSTVGASSCTYFFATCPVGTYASGTAACDSCPTGKYQNEDGKAYCNNYCPYSKVLTLDARCIDNKVYKARTSGQCGDSGGGWGKITSAAQCDAGAAALGWGDTTAETFGGLQDPSGCFLHSVNFGLRFNTGNSNVGCTSDDKCLCTLTCPPGTYQDQSGQSSCKTCAQDTYSTVGASSCAYTATTCPAGTYASGTATVCNSCASGQYSIAGADSCSYNATTCPVGTYASGTAACDSCPTGKYQNEEGKASCNDDCVNVLTLDARCIDNTIGYKERTSGQCGDSDGWRKITSAAACKVGAVNLTEYEPGTQVSVRTNNGQQGSNWPPGCLIRYYGNGQKQLWFNTHNTNVACTSDDKCLCTQTCGPGTYQDQSGQTSCKTCASGTYSTVGASSCAYTATTCPAGTYASGTATVCNSCATGKYSTVGASSCSYTATTCPAGTYASGISACETCGSGTYSTVGASTCKSCPTGKYNEQTSQTSCKSCEVGEYQNEVGQSSCMNDCASPKVITWDARCIDNKVYKVRSENPFGGQCGDSGGGWGKITSAAACGAGAAAFGWSDTTAQTVSWSGKPSGCYYAGELYFNTYSDYSGLCGHSGACLCTRTCPAGTYQNEVGQSSCKTCASGQYSPAAGASSCPYSATTCPAGTYYASGTATICDSCASGTYSTFGASSCPYTATTCPAGTYASGTAAVCNSCDRGQYSTVGASSCPYSATACPVGTYASGAAACETCASGKYNEQTGQTSESVACKICDVGQYQNEEGKAEGCKTCASGTYSNGTSCYRCLPGYYSANCEKCPVGRYTGWENNILYECRLCKGYQDEEGQGTCKKCPSGRISLANRTTCVTCPLGKYSDAENLNACKSCQNGEQHTGIIGQNISVCTSGNMKGEFEYNVSYKTQNLIIYGYKAKLKDVAMNIHTAFETNCSANYYQNTFNGSCKECPVGLYKEADSPGLKIVGPKGFNTCRFCTAGRHAVTNTCSDCALAADNYNEQILKDFPHQECRYGACSPGLFAQNGECSECPAGTYWESREVIGIQYEYSILHSCGQMETQFHADLNATQRALKKDQCEQCPSLTLTDKGACQAGNDLRASTTTYPGLCRSCPVGQYQDSTGQVTCKSCSNDTATTGSATSCL